MLRIYRDFSSIAPIRCTAKIDGSPFYAEGTGFSVHRAMEKCLSELAEANFQVRNKIKALGIAAHRDALKSERHAYLEALETVMLNRIAADRTMKGFAVINTANLKIWCTKINGFWFSMLTGKHHSSSVFTYAARTSLISSILQSWSEYRNIKFYNVGAGQLANYTKANKLFQSFTPSLIISFKEHQIDTSYFKKLVHQESSHVVTYFTTGENK
jgi:hypothetical protein